MFKIGDFVVYKRDVCVVKEIVEKHYQDTDYYLLNPIDDSSLKIYVLTNNNDLRNVISKEEAFKLIEKIPSIEIISSQDKMMENHYKELMKNDCLEDLITIIKTAYLRNDDRLKQGKKISEKDDNYFKRAEKILYNELSIALNMSVLDTKDYIIKNLENK